jgi:hypothetical protein
MANMELTDSERAEFLDLIEDSYDPELWLENDLPFLRKAKAEYEKRQAWERGHLHLVQQPTLTDDDENGWPYDPRQL